MVTPMLVSEVLFFFSGAEGMGDPKKNTFLVQNSMTHWEYILVHYIYIIYIIIYISVYIYIYISIYIYIHDINNEYMIMDNWE
jgi:hypothetical protein